MSPFPSRPRGPSWAALRRFTGAVCVMAASLLVSGCLAQKHYVDPALPQVAIADLKQPEVKHPVQAFIEFQTNGTTNAKATEKVAPMIVDTLKKANLFTDVVVAPATADRKLFITINNVGDLHSAISKGVGTGLTFGLAGNMVTDGYVMKTAYDVPGIAEVTHSYQHALYTTIGNASGPPGLTAVPAEQAVRAVMDGMTLNLLNDMSKAGELK